MLQFLGDRGGTYRGSLGLFGRHRVDVARPAGRVLLPDGRLMLSHRVDEDAVPDAPNMAHDSAQRRRKRSNQHRLSGGST